MTITIVPARVLLHISLRATNPTQRREHHIALSEHQPIVAAEMIRLRFACRTAQSLTCVLVQALAAGTMVPWRGAMVLVGSVGCSKVQSFIPPSNAHQRPRYAARCRRNHCLKAAESVTGLSCMDIPVSLYNTASRRKEPFRPSRPGKVSFYSCGPTVYDFAHIGNFRAFLTYDILKRWLIYCGLEVDHVCNLTDVDDKIIKRMARDGLTLRQLTDKFSEAFFDDLKALNIVPASRYPRATEHIDDMIAMIQELMAKGFAYESQDSVYFRVSKFSRYGSLANLDFEGMVDGSGEGGGSHDADEYVTEKGDAKDFALWKAYKEEDGPVFWETALGKGRPGWHIECSAMARRFLGDTLDLHAGGVDLVFPHHENEVAQSEAATGRPFCNCWVHNGFVNVNNEKMSKSKGNFLTLRDMCKSDLELRAFRYLVVTSQYRMPLNFNVEALEASKKALTRLDKLRSALQHGIGQEPPAAETREEQAQPAQDAVSKTVADFEAALADDLNTPRASAALFSLVKAAEKMIKAGMGPQAASAFLAGLETMDRVFGIFYATPSSTLPDAPSTMAAAKQGPLSLEDVSQEVEDLIDQRAAAKAAKDWGLADTIRERLKVEHRLTVKDVKGGGVVLEPIDIA